MRETIVCCAILSASCIVGDDPIAPADPVGEPAPPPPTSAREVFDREVSPVLRDRCASCHAGELAANGPDFLGIDADYYEDVIRAQTIAGVALVALTADDSPLVQKGAHAGPAFSPDEITAIARWLTAEADERDEPPPATAPDYATAAAWFASCMTYTRWTTERLAELPYTLTDRAPCYGCHDSGQHGVYLGADAPATFDAHRDPASPYLARLIRAKYDGDVFVGLEPAAAYVVQGSAGGIHPAYSLSEPIRIGLDAFVTATITASATGACATP